MSNAACTYDDEAIAQCLQNNMSKLSPYLSAGIPKYGIPKFAPFTAENVITNEPIGPEKDVFLSVSYALITGLTDYILQEMEISIRDKWLKFDVFCPQLNIDGQYSITGNYRDAPIAGRGIVRAKYLRCLAKCTLKWEIVIRSGQKYVHLTFCETKMEVGKSTNIYVENFDFPVIIDERMGSESASTGDEFWALVKQDLITIANGKIASSMKTILDNLFNAITYDCFLSYLRSLTANNMAGTCFE